MCLRRLTIRHHERGLAFLDAAFQAVLRPGPHYIVDPFRRVHVDVVSVRDVWLRHGALAAIVASGELAAELEVVDVQANERAVVWVNDTIEAVVGPGLYALWTTLNSVHADIVDARVVPLEQRPRSHEPSPTV
jgi:hypothetical protein